jgi:hypothetical protein
MQATFLRAVCQRLTVAIRARDDPLIIYCKASLSLQCLFIACGILIVRQWMTSSLLACRNLRKKHAKVAAAKEKRAQGVALTAEQLSSIDNEGALLSEMRELGATDV